MLLLAAAIAGCGDSNQPGGSALAGTYAATTLRVTPSGEPPIDVLASGGSLTLTIDAQNQVTGTLSIPESFEGGLNASMAGTAVITGTNVRFDQAADTFVGELTFAMVGAELRADQSLSGARYEVILTRP